MILNANESITRFDPHVFTQIQLLSVCEEVLETFTIPNLKVLNCQDHQGSFAKASQDWHIVGHFFQHDKVMQTDVIDLLYFSTMQKYCSDADHMVHLLNNYLLGWHQ